MGRSVEADPFAGLWQRYATDLGVRHRLWRDDRFAGAAEAGYRYQFENRAAGQLSAQVLRLFLEMAYQWSKTTSLLWGNEFLPDFNNLSDWRLNTEVDLNVEINTVFSLTAAYGLRYDHIPAAADLQKLDKQLMTGLKAKF